MEVESYAASFFRYDNKQFYQELKKVTQDLENYLAQCGNEKCENEDQAEVYKIIGEKTTKVYSCVSNYYLGM